MCIRDRTHPDGYRHASFGNYLMRYRMVTHVVGHVEHYDGAQMYIDLAGDQLEVVDSESGECRSVEVFVAILPCCLLYTSRTQTYAERRKIGS